MADFVFLLQDNSVEDMVNTFGLEKVLSNERTDIYQNDDMKLSVDERVIRVILFDEKNISLLEKLREYFYGKEYSQCDKQEDCKMSEWSEQFLCNFPEAYKNVSITGERNQIQVPICFSLENELRAIEFIDVPNLSSKDKEEIRERFKVYKEKGIYVCYVLNARELNFEEEWMCGDLQHISFKKDFLHLKGYKKSDEVALYLDLDRGEECKYGTFLKVGNVYANGKNVCFGSVYDDFLSGLFDREHVCRLLAESKIINNDELRGDLCR